MVLSGFCCAALHCRMQKAKANFRKKCNVGKKLNSFFLLFSFSLEEEKYFCYKLCSFNRKISLFPLILPLYCAHSGSTQGTIIRGFTMLLRVMQGNLF